MIYRILILWPENPQPEVIDIAKNSTTEEHSFETAVIEILNSIKTFMTDSKQDRTTIELNNEISYSFMNFNTFIVIIVASSPRESEALIRDLEDTYLNRGADAVIKKINDMKSVSSFETLMRKIFKDDDTSIDDLDDELPF